MIWRSQAYHRDAPREDAPGADLGAAKRIERIPNPDEAMDCHCQLRRQGWADAVHHRQRQALRSPHACQGRQRGEVIAEREGQ